MKCSVTTQGWTGQWDDTQATGLHEVWEWSTQSQQVVNRGSEHVQTSNTRPRATLLVLGGPMPQHSTKTVDKSHTATVSHGCARGLLKPCSNQFQSFQRCRLVVNSCCIRVAINTERGTACSASTRAHRPVPASASRLLVPPSSPLS